MRVQVLVAAMNQYNHSLLEKMHIQSDVIVGNQCDFNGIEHFEYKGYSATYLNFEERGVGLNRNNTLMRATGDICLFADDDMVYVENYPELIEKAFWDYPDADIIAFNLVEKIPYCKMQLKLRGLISKNSKKMHTALKLQKSCKKKLKKLLSLVLTALLLLG